MYGRSFELLTLGNTNNRRQHERTYTGLLGSSASVYKYARALITWLTRGRNVTFTLLRFSVPYAISYPTTSDFQRYGGKNLAALAMQHDFGCAEGDISGQRGSSAIRKGNAESRFCGYGRTNQHTRERDFPLDCTAIIVFSPKHLRMYFSDQSEVEL